MDDGREPYKQEVERGEESWLDRNVEAERNLN